MKTHLLTILTVAAAMPLSVAAQGVKFVHTANDSTVYLILKKDRDVKFRDAAVPHFAIHTLDNKFVMTIGGQIQPIIGADLGNNLYNMDDAGIGFVTNQIPVPPPAGKKATFFINGLNAAVDFQVVGFGGTANQITGYIKIGTNGINNTIDLKKAYVSYRGFSMGLKTTLMEDGLACQPPTIDTEGPSGEVSTSSYVIHYTSPSYKGLRAAIGIEIPTFNASSGVYRGKDYKEWKDRPIDGKVVCDPNYYNQLVPDIPMWVEWAKSDQNRIRVSGIIRTLRYRDMLENKCRTSVGWGVMLSGNFSPWQPITFNAQAIYGKGIGNYIQDLAGIPLSYTPQNSSPGKMTPTPEMGLSFGVSWNLTRRLQWNAMYSMARMWDVGVYARESDASQNPENLNNYRYTNYVATNLFYNISSFFQVGVEYLYGQRHTYSKGQAHDNRIQAQVSFFL